MLQLESRFAKFIKSTPPPRIILGSSSSSRRLIMNQLAEQFCFTYEVRSADIDEAAIRRPVPEQLVTALAKAKQHAIIAQMRAAEESMTGYLITCDQVVVCRGQVLEKPQSEEQARRFLQSYGPDAPAETVGAVEVTDLSRAQQPGAEGLHTGNGSSFSACDRTATSFKALPASVINALIAEGQVFYCAGGLMVEHPLVQDYIHDTIGTQDTIMGLCKETVMRGLTAVSQQT